MEETKLITLFISAWMWQIMAIIFFCFMVISTSLQSWAYFVIFFVLFLVCQTYTFIRKNEVWEFGDKIEKKEKIKSKKGAGLLAYAFWVFVGFCIGIFFTKAFLC